MMSQHRADRLKEVIKTEISDIIRKDLKDPRIGEMTSITGVEVSNDLRHAKVFASVFGDEDKQKEAIKGLQSAAGFIRAELAKRIRLRHMPEIIFYLDSSIAYGAKMSALINQVKKESEQGG
jgi:ribosome-binding factor A